MQTASADALKALRQVRRSCVCYICLAAEKLQMTCWIRLATRVWLEPHCSRRSGILQRLHMTDFVIG